MLRFSFQTIEKIKEKERKELIVRSVKKKPTIICLFSFFPPDHTGASPKTSMQERAKTKLRLVSFKETKKVRDRSLAYRLRLHHAICIYCPRRQNEKLRCRVPLLQDTYVRIIIPLSLYPLIPFVSFFFFINFLYECKREKSIKKRFLVIVVHDILPIVSDISLSYLSVSNMLIIIDYKACDCCRR